MGKNGVVLNSEQLLAAIRDKVEHPATARELMTRLKIPHEQRATVKAWLGIGTPPSAPAAATAGGARGATAAWAAASTPSGALFFTDDFDFRIRARRAITGSFKDGALFFLTGTRPFTAWYRLDREVAACRAVRGRECWFALARRLGADYAIVDPGVAQAAPEADFERVFERDGWSVWRRLS